MLWLWQHPSLCLPRQHQPTLPRGLPLGLPRGGVYLPEEYLEEADRPYLVACPAPPEKVLV